MTAKFRERYLKARQELISSDFSRLNSEQRRAVMTVEGPLLLLAGAGSGKTTVLINRIVNLMRYGTASESGYVPDSATEEDIAVMEAGVSDEARRIAAVDPVAPWNIIAITFTNKAAGELKTRLENALGDGADEIWAQTFHSACLRILRRDADRLGFSKNFTIYDTTDSQSLAKRIIKDMDLDEKLFPYRYVISVISKAKDDMLSPEEFCAQPSNSYDVRRSKIGEIYKEYARRLREADAMDFDDLILNTVLLLRDNEDIRRHYQLKFKYVLVDEYQDTNNLQYLLASTLAGGYENICVVGDDDQSIYKFRGATIKNILDFEQEYKNARVIKLEQNYRSSGHILAAANGVIGNNTERKGKTLWTAADDGYKPYLYVAPNENEEAQFVADKILEGFAQGVNWNENAVLYRINAQSNQLEYAFKRRGIPYRIYGGTKFFDRAEIKDILAYLSIIVNPNDDLRLLRVINTPARGIGATTIERVGAFAKAQNIHILDVLRAADTYTELQRSAVRLRQFSILIDELRELSYTLPADELYDEVLERTGYLDHLMNSGPENESRIENVRELKTNILNYMKDSGDSGLLGFMDEVALYTDLDNMDEDASCVSMMTIHSAKGLEFPTVFLVGAEEGLFPGIKAIGEHEEMEEERRLCYVAITRAMRRLYISCATQRMIFGRTSNNRVSRFIEEIPPEHIETSYIPRGYSFSDVPAGLSGYEKPRTRVVPVVTPATVSAALPKFSRGDNVEHKSFGRGMIVAMTPMGGDYLVEIAFDKVGTKRLMLKAASRLMEKV